MSNPPSRLQRLLGHFTASPPPKPHVHQLSPTFFLERAAQIEPDAPAIYHVCADGQELRRSYADWAARARGIAYYFRQHGFRRIGILCTNTPAFLDAFFGAAAAGGVSVAINYRLKPDDLAYIFAHADVDLIVVDREFLPLLDGFCQSHPNVPLLVDDDLTPPPGELVAHGPFDAAIRAGWAHEADTGADGWADLHGQCADEEEMISLAYTSGTTSRPKGVTYTHRGAYLAALGNVIESGLNYHRGRCGYLWTLPMFHATGWTFPWAVTAVRGTHYCLRKIDYPLIWKLLKTEPITHFNAAPTVNTLLCAAKEAERLEHPVRVTVAASPPSAHLFEQMESLNLVPVHVYGMTETYGPITKGYHMPAWDELDKKDKYVKMARQGHGFVTSLPIRVIKTEQPEGVLIDVEKNGTEIGEIIFVGNICAKEYYKDEEATRKLFAGGVLHSGDLAVCHPDGAIQILDRAKDVIISGGENISSVALESQLVQHPAVLEAAVVAVADQHWGEIPKAFVTVRDGASLAGDELIAWAKQHPGISRFMVPREVEVLEELPKTSTGKVKKNVLRAWATGGSREDSS